MKSKKRDKLEPGRAALAQVVRSFQSTIVPELHCPRCGFDRLDGFDHGPFKLVCCRRCGSIFPGNWGLCLAG